LLASKQAEPADNPVLETPAAVSAEIEPVLEVDENRPNPETIQMKMTALMGIENDEYLGLVPRPTGEEYDSLVESIRENGLRIPIIVNRRGVILDGYTRYRACREANVEPRYEVKEFPSKADEKLFILDTNLRRRHLNNFQKAELCDKMLEIEKELAKQRMLNGKPAIEFAKGKAIKKTANRLGMSEKTLEHAREVIAKGTHELIDKARSGKVSINKAWYAVQPEGKIPPGFRVHNHHVKCPGCGLEFAWIKPKDDAPVAPDRASTPLVAAN
jgi:hypothetical protein